MAEAKKVRPNVEPMNLHETKHHLKEHAERVLDVAARLSDVDGPPLSHEDEQVVRVALASTWLSDMLHEVRYCFMHGQKDAMQHTIERINMVLSQFV